MIVGELGDVCAVDFTHVVSGEEEVFWRGRPLLDEGDTDGAVGLGGGAEGEESGGFHTMKAKKGSSNRVLPRQVRLLYRQFEFLFPLLCQ